MADGWFDNCPIQSIRTQPIAAKCPPLHITIYITILAEQEIWQQAATAAIQFWHACAQTPIFSLNFRTIYQKNSDALANLHSKIKPSIQG